MTPTILIAGATGNTGKGVVESLSKFLHTAEHNFSGHRILALTRSTSGPTAREQAKLSSVEVVEKSWAEVTPEWLRENNVVRAFIASHMLPNHFAEESTFHLALLEAGVEYVVRVSTTAANVRPDCPAYYPRTHWALEALLGSSEFQGLQWTSLQPNVFTQFYLAPAAQLVKTYRKTGKQDTLRLIASEDAPVGIIDAYEVGVFAAHLLTLDDVTPHNKAKYVLNGPEDITGREVVSMVEQYIGNKVKDVRFKDLSFIDQQAADTTEAKTVILSIKRALDTAWEGKCKASTTSDEVLRIAPPKHASADTFKIMVEE